MLSVRNRTAQGTINYGDFMRNRFLRIFPLFFTVFLVAASIGRDKFQPQDILMRRAYGDAKPARLAPAA